MRKGWKYWIFVRVPFWFLLASMAIVTLLRWVPVRYTPVMLKRAFQFRQEPGYRSEQEWVSLDEISPELIKAVVLAEDQKFWKHHGFDWEEIGLMWESHRQQGTRIRGCSTISQQTAKNVFTFGSPTIIRKGLEAWWTFLIEMIWGKERIIEVYLNVVEMGQGVYGMQTASKKYFGLTADELSAKESVCLAVCLPAPLTCSPFQLTRKEIRRRNRLIASIRQ